LGGTSSVTDCPGTAPERRAKVNALAKSGEKIVTHGLMAAPVASIVWEAGAKNLESYRTLNTACHARKLCRLMRFIDLRSIPVKFAALVWALNSTP